MICLPLMGGNQKGACAGDLASGLTCTEGATKKRAITGSAGSRPEGTLLFTKGCHCEAGQHENAPILSICRASPPRVSHAPSL